MRKIKSHFENFAENNIANEHYKKELFAKEDRAKIAELKSAINEGIQSGRAIDFNPATYLAFLKQKNCK